MSRKRKAAPKAIIDAGARLTNLKSIDPALNLGAGLTNAIFEGSINDYYSLLDTYNQTIALLDSQLNNLENLEKTTSDLSVRMLSGVGVKYGYDSNEYEMAGGTRKSERAAPARKSKPTP